MKSKVLSMFVLLGMALFWNTGCALLVGGAAGAGTVAYLEGDLESTEDITLNRLWDAVQKAVEDLEFDVESKDKDALAAKLVARSADDKDIRIDLKRKTDKMTEIKIRVGKIGDESRSLKILEEIKKHY